MGGKSAYFENEGGEAEMKGGGGQTIKILYRIPFIKVQGEGETSARGDQYSPVKCILML